MKIQLTRNHYRCARKVVWDDVIDKINYDQNVSMDIVGRRPTFVCRSDYLPKRMRAVQKKVGLPQVYLFTSFIKESDTFGRHKDEKDVLLVQSIGKMSYMVDGKIYELFPGDSLLIPEGIYHTPYPSEPRATLSFSNLDISPIEINTII